MTKTASLFADPKTLSKDALEHGTTFAPKFDANGLVTAITIEEGTNDVLMVAFMDAQAIALTLETGFAHYFSRSRGKIWKKGESSGELQHVRQMRTDCDQDAIVLTVVQSGHGAACHTGRKSCFYREVALADGKPVLQDAGQPQLFDPKDIYKS